MQLREKNGGFCFLFVCFFPSLFSNRKRKEELLHTHKKKEEGFGSLLLQSGGGVGATVQKKNGERGSLFSVSKKVRENVYFFLSFSQLSVSAFSTFMARLMNE